MNNCGSGGFQPEGRATQWTLGFKGRTPCSFAGKSAPLNLSLVIFFTKIQGQIRPGFHAGISSSRPAGDSPRESWGEARNVLEYLGPGDSRRPIGILPELLRVF
jgi:hypothetical protein